MVFRCAVRAVAAAAFFGQVGFAAQAFPEEVAAFTDRH